MTEDDIKLKLLSLTSTFIEAFNNPQNPESLASLESVSNEIVQFIEESSSQDIFRALTFTMIINAQLASLTQMNLDQLNNSLFMPASMNIVTDDSDG